MNLGLKNKRILITGASRGLGYVCAKALAGEGAKLALVARSADDLQKAIEEFDSPKDHIAIAADLTDTKELTAAVENANEFLKEIDVVLHVAGGGLGLRDPLLGFEDLIRLFTLNVAAAAQINRLVLPGMMKKRSGNLVHIASISSAEATGSVGYNTAKSALAAYVRSLGREVAGSGVIVTGIAPGGYYAPGNSWERLKAKDPQAVEKFIKERLPRGFLGKAEELVPMILLLCSKHASMMGGCLVPADAGEGRAYNIHE